MNRTFACIDIKCNDISAVAAHIGKKGECVIEGYAFARSRGIHRGAITDMKAAADTIGALMEKFSGKTENRIRNVYVTASPLSVGIVPTEGHVILSRYGKEVTVKDVKDAVKAGAIIKMPPEKEQIHRLVRDYSIDGESGIKDPIGLEGVKLRVKLDIIMADSSIVRNLDKCVALAGFSLKEVVFSPLAYAERALTDKNKDAGSVLVNICADMTEASLFHQGHLADAKVFRLGAKDMIGTGGQLNESVIAELAAGLKTLNAWDKAEEMIMAGEAAEDERILELFEKQFTIPVRSASCISHPHENLPTERSAYIGSLGLLDYLDKKRKELKTSRNPFNRAVYRLQDFLEEYF